jgi:glycerol-3-phosphate cytidylyltransferase
MLEEASSQCDWLIVALQTDPTLDRPEKNRPVQSLPERWIQVQGCRWVDEIVPYGTEAELEQIFQTWDLDVRIIGEEYQNQEFTAKGICLDRGIRIYYNSRGHYFSTTELRRRIQDAD